MKRKVGKKVFVFLFLLPLLGGVFTCATEEETPMELLVQTKIAEGKTHVGNAAFDDAIDAFNVVLDNYDPDNTEAKFGVAFSEILKLLVQFGDSWKQIADMVAPILGGAPSHPSVTPQQTTGINMIIDSMIEDNLTASMNYALPFLEEVEQDPGFSMRFDRAPVVVEVEPYISWLLDIAGEYDLGEVHFLQAGFKFLKGMAMLVASMNFQLSSSALTVLGSQFLPLLTGETAELDMNREMLFDSLTTILESSPNFFTLEPNQGPARMNEAADLMAGAIDDLFKFLEAIQAETDDQVDDVMAYKPEGNREFFVVKVWDELQETQIRMTVQFSNTVKLSLEKIKSSYDASGGVRANWARDIAPFLGFFIQGMWASTIPSQVIELVLPYFDQFIGEDTAVLITDMMATFENLASEELLAGMLTMVIPDVIEFDLGKFFRDPPDDFLRLMMPPVSTDGEGNPKLLIEYECEDDLAPADFWCQNPEAITTTAHFVGTPSYIDDDGLKSALPYIAFEDPSLGGFLYLNLYTLDRNQFSNEFHPPDSYEFNFLLSYLLGEFLSGGLF